MIPFIKLATDFYVSWNLDDMISRISNDIIDPNNNRSPYYHPSGIAHWQYYDTVNISFARNFHRNFRRECSEIANKLKDIQRSLTPTSELLNAFIEHEITPRRVNVLRTIGGGNVQPHSDITRDVCINIGLRNSNIFKTRISNNLNAAHFYDTPTNDFVMNDGDVYIVSTKNAHSVESLSNTLESRYIITYNLK